MKFKTISDPNMFFKAVSKCIGKVEMQTSEGDTLNLKSSLSQYILYCLLQYADGLLLAV